MARPANPQLRDQILKAAAQIIETCGPDCVTMREVAETVGYSPTTLYLYFKDKSAIIQAAVMEAFDDLNDTCRLAMVGPGALDMLRQRARAYVIWGLTHPGHYSLMFELPWDMDWSVHLTEENVGRFTQGRTEDVALLRQAASAGDIAQDSDIEAIEDALWAALHGATALAISGRLTAAIPQAPATERVAVATRVSDTLVNAVIASAQAR